MSHPKKPTRPARLAYLWSSLAHYERLAEAAELAESYIAAVQARHKALAVRGDIAELEAQIAAAKKRPPRSPEDHRVEVLSDARRLRAAATSAGSYVAAATLLRVEAELLKQPGPDGAVEGMATEDLEQEIAALRDARSAGG